MHSYERKVHQQKNPWLAHEDAFPRLPVSRGTGNNGRGSGNDGNTHAQQPTQDTRGGDGKYQVLSPRVLDKNCCALRIMMWNANGLLSGGRELALAYLLESNSVDVMVVTETEIPDT
jgi:hypothetical protein